MSTVFRVLKWVLVTIVVGGGISCASAVAQTPLSSCESRTATNATLILPDDLQIMVNGAPYDSSAQVAVLDSTGTCAGMARWNGNSTTLTAWGHQDPPRVAGRTALAPGDSLYLYVRLSASTTEYTPENSRIDVAFRSRPHTVDVPQYRPNGIYVLDEISIQALPLSER